MKNLKFSDVNLIESMEKIAEVHMVAYKSDLEIDKEKLRKAAENPPKPFLWMCRTMGTWLLDEHNVFLEDTPENRIFSFYQEQRIKSILLFAVEVTGRSGDAVMGNLYLLDDSDYYCHVLMKSQKAHTVMHYEKGDRLIPVINMTSSDDTEYGKLLSWDYLAEAEDNLSIFLQEIHKIRAGFVNGNFSDYLAELCNTHLQEVH